MTLPPLIDIETFFADPAIGAPKISPDGRRLAYLAPNYGRLQVWVRGVDEEHEDAVCLTRSERRGIYRFQWTYDPRWLLYEQDTDGNEDWHLYRVDLEDPTAPAVDLTPMDPGSRVFGATPLKDRPGTVLAVMNKRPLFLDTFWIDIATGETTVVREQDNPRHTYLTGEDGLAHWMTKLCDDGTVEIHAVDDPGTENESLRLVRSQGGEEYPLGMFPMQPTKDNTGLLVGSYEDGDDLKLIRIDHATGDVTVVAEVEGHSVDTAEMVAPGMLPATIILNPKTDEVAAVRFVGDKPFYLILDPEFGEIYEAMSGLSDGLVGALSHDLDGDRWTVAFIHDQDPGRTYYYDHSTREGRFLFKAFPWFTPENMAPMTPVSTTARDGLPLHGFLTLPLGVEPKNLPLVLDVHGGPWAHDSWGFNREAQFLANRGYAVLQINFRGSTGYGKRHVTSAIGEFGGTMHNDLIDFADWAVEQGYADPSRIAIYGGSYGGYAALIGVTVTPDYFAAAVDYCGISDLANFMRTLPPFVRPMMINNWYRYVGDPADPEQEADMLARSAITMVDKIRTPLLVAQGAMDVRVVQAESDNIVESLRSRGVPVEYVLAEDEGHGFANPENQMRMYRAVERHFAEHLGGRTADVAAG